jgi:hypothetical protein
LLLLQHGQLHFQEMFLCKKLLLLLLLLLRRLLLQHL